MKTSTTNFYLTTEALFNLKIFTFVLSFFSAIMAGMEFLVISFPAGLVGGITEYDRAITPWIEISCGVYLSVSLILGISFALLQLRKLKKALAATLFFLCLTVFAATLFTIHIALPYYLKHILHLNAGAGG